MGPITLTIVTPLIGALLLALAPRSRDRDVKAVGLVVSLATFASSLWLLASFDLANPDLQLSESYTWIPSIGVRFAFAVDGAVMGSGTAALATGRLARRAQTGMVRTYVTVMVIVVAVLLAAAVGMVR